MATLFLMARNGESRILERYDAPPEIRVAVNTSSLIQWWNFSNSEAPSFPERRYRHVGTDSEYDIHYYEER